MIIFFRDCNRLVVVGVAIHSCPFEWVFIPPEEHNSGADCATGKQNQSTLSIKCQGLIHSDLF